MTIPEAALRALPAKWREIATQYDTGRRVAGTIEATQLRICADELAAILRQIEAAPSPPDSSQLQRRVQLAIEHGDEFGWEIARSELSGIVDSNFSPDSSQGEPVAFGLFNEAIAWGATYEKVIPRHQWNQMRSEQAASFAARLTTHPSSPQVAVAFDMLAHLLRQREWSKRTFGPGARTAGVVDHIRKELCEVEADPLDLAEWVDVVILALDGAWRCGGSPEQIIAGIVAKQTKNEGRQWPDWRTADPDKAIEHTKESPQ